MAIIIPRLIRKRFHKRIWCYVPRTFESSDKPLTVLIPLASKDVQRARLAIESIRRHVLHPLSDIVIVGEDSEGIRDLCRELGVRYINEDDVLPRNVNAPRFNGNGSLRVRGWVRQQLLKLTCFDFLGAENVLVFDADTYLVRDLAFFVGNRQILFLADEYTKKYEYLLRFLLGPIKRHPRSFIAHFMLFQRDVMNGLNEKVIQICGLTLSDAILANLDIASKDLSEYEIYGNYMYNFAPGRFVMRYWYNQNLPANWRPDLTAIETRFRHMNSVSDHEH